MAGGVYGLYDLLESSSINLLEPGELLEALDLASDGDGDRDPAAVWASEPGVVVIDGRDFTDYQSGHVPGALSMPYFDLFFEWRSPRYVDLARRVVASGRTVVTYANTGGSDGIAAGRCMRLCNYWFEIWAVPVGRMRRLDGGYQRWKAEGFPTTAVETGTVPRPPRYVAHLPDDNDDGGGGGGGGGASVSTRASSSASFPKRHASAWPPLPLAARFSRSTERGAAPDAEEGLACYVVSARSGARVRARESLDSHLVYELPRFLRVAAPPPPPDAPPPARLRVRGPWGAGWVSAKCLAGPLDLDAAPEPVLPPVPPPPPPEEAAPGGAPPPPPTTTP